MTRPFGINFDEENIASVFATCVSCFDYTLQEGTNDWLTLRLSVVRLRLTRWGEAVNVYNDPYLGQVEPDPDDVESVKSVLVKMVAIFDPSATSIEEPAEDPTPNQTTNLERLLSTLKNIASERSKSTSLLIRSSLAPRQWFTGLVTVCSEHIDKLDDYFPAARRQRELCESERLRIEEKDALRNLGTAAIGIDPLLSRTLTEIPIMGTNIVVGVNFGNVGIVVGDKFAGDKGVSKW